MQTLDVLIECNGHITCESLICFYFFIPWSCSIGFWKIFQMTTENELVWYIHAFITWIKWTFLLTGGNKKLIHELIWMLTLFIFVSTVPLTSEQHAERTQLSTPSAGRQLVTWRQRISRKLNSLSNNGQLSLCLMFLEEFLEEEEKKKKKKTHYKWYHVKWITSWNKQS